MNTRSGEAEGDLRDCNDGIMAQSNNGNKGIYLAWTRTQAGRRAGRQARPASNITTRMQATHHATKGPEFLGPRAAGPAGTAGGREGSAAAIT